MNSIKTKGLLISISIILFAISALSLSTYFRFKSMLVDEVNTAVVRIANESADHISSYIQQFISPLVGISKNEDVQSMDWEKQKQVILSQIIPQYLNIAVVYSDGVAHYLDDSKLDLSDREYIQKTLKGEISFSDVLISRKTGNPVIMVGVPIRADDVIKGALIARLDVDFLSDFATTRGYGDNGKAYIISEAGTFISRPEQERSIDVFNIHELAARDPNFTSFSDFLSESQLKEAGYGHYRYIDRIILMGYASVEETNWKIFVGTFEDEALSSMKGMRRMILLEVLATLLISTIAAWVFVEKFTRPIVELDNLFSQGARGNLTIRFTPKSKDEIGRVGISFNRMMDKIKTLTQYDPLTSLLNQFVLEKDIESLVHSEDGKQFSLIMIAIDRFNFINETYGYNIGDAMLVEVAKRSLTNASENSQVYRYKGDEFVIVYKNGEHDAELMTQRLLNALKEAYQFAGKTIIIEVSIGVYNRNDLTMDEEPLKAVTQAKNYAKYLGGNQIQKFDAQIYNKLMVMKDLQADIINGLKENQFFLVYQPMFRLDQEKITEVEALIRWNHPEKGLLYPDQFIELAEQSGSILNIDQWVFETACKQLLSWKERNIPPIMLSVNISAKTFETKKFIPEFVALIHRYGIDPKLLQLEITERMVIKNVEDSICKLKELRAMGIRVSIDDFGSGYSSLNYIVRLPIDSIKIDKSFIQNIGVSRESKIIVSTIINLCKKLHLSVVAEGIESKQELDYLKSNQCDIGQGYYFSKPVHIHEIEKAYINLK